MPKYTCLIIVFIVLVSFNAVAQKSDTTVYFLKFSGEILPDRTGADFVRLLLSPDSTVEDKNLIIVKDFYMNGKKKLIGLSSVKSVNFQSGLQGTVIEYYINGRRKSVNSYLSGKQTGESVSYYPNGKVYNTISYTNGDYSLREYSDSTGKVLAENGTGDWVYYDDKFAVTSAGKIKDGKEDGEWIEFTENGKRIYNYTNGMMLSVKLPGDSLPIFRKVDEAPKFPGGDAEFAMFLAKNVRYPAVASEHHVQGKLVASFVVEKDGRITNVKIESGLGYSCDEEVLRVISMSPVWTPGKQNGQLVRVSHTISLQFSSGENWGKVEKL